MSHVKVRSLTTYYILMAKFGELSIELYALELTLGSQQQHAHLVEVTIKILENYMR